MRVSFRPEPKELRADLLPQEINRTPEGVWMTPTGKDFNVPRDTSSASLVEVS
jgi:hypothetical protein